MEMWHTSGSTSGVTSVSVTLGSGTHGGAIAWHVKNIASGNDATATSAPSTTAITTPWTGSAVSTSGSTEFLAAVTWVKLKTYNSGAQNAGLATGSWTQGGTICAGSTTSPCTLASGEGNLDGGNGGVLMFAYQIVSSASISNTGTNNGSANVYDNFPGIAGFK
jgi:hypothetical protein